MRKMRSSSTGLVLLAMLSEVKDLADGGLASTWLRLRTCLRCAGHAGEDDHGSADDHVEDSDDRRGPDGQLAIT
jgi:hypothetical protein